MQVSALHVFPVKSLRGFAAQVGDVERLGLRDDRRWMVVDDHGEVLTARALPAMLSVTATTETDGTLTLHARGREPLRVPVPVAGAAVAVGLSRVGTAVAAGPRADAWLAGALGVPAHLVWLDDPTRRTVSPRHGGELGDVLSLADTGPLLLTSQVSLRQVDRWSVHAHAERVARCGASAGTRPAPLAMERFRPNVVVDGDLEPFAEDGWQRVRIGDVDFRVTELCDRCVLTTLDPHTQVRGQEPLRTLAKHRRWDGMVWFGIRLVPVTTGRIRVGDRVEAWTSPAAQGAVKPTLGL
ncbi:MOSC domain-containing protein [Actinotalea subterranea]|uniref:MOSC domain-containing protein n=1 Tax=Actinotalea subterranea TaxID=2607497 RepID=UPI0011EE5AE4|nr:MOSC N-terminal beta barrel domain-containing protein [Actinotalea subterranea]